MLFTLKTWPFIVTVFSGGVEVTVVPAGVVKDAGGPFGEGVEVGGLRSAILLKARWAAILVEVGKRGEAEEWGGKCNSEVAVEAENGS